MRLRTTSSGSRPRCACCRSAIARAGAGSCSSTSPAAGPSAPPARRRTRARACGGRLAGGAERPAAGDVLEHDPAAALGIALAYEPERRLDALCVVVSGLGELLHRQRL